MVESLTLHPIFIVNSVRIKVCILFLLCLCACQDKSLKTEPADSEIKTSQDTLHAVGSIEDSMEVSVSVPMAADEYFSDFIYNFTSDEVYQKSRISFPLLCVNEGDTTYLQKHQWYFSRLHMKIPVYTRFLDNKSSLYLEKSKEISEVKMDYFYLPERTMRTYFFQKENNRWKMNKIVDQSLDEYPDHDFILFYQEFASDSVFQMNHIKPLLSVLMVDPDDEFETIDGVLDADQWPAFHPELPVDVFTNIRCGADLNYRNRRVVVLQGSMNGYISLLFFVREDGAWRLERFEN